MATAIASEAARLGELGLSDRDLARATGAARSTARAWLSGRSGASGERAERLIELGAMAERLERVMSPDYVALWLRKPIAALDDEKPLEVIGAGGYRRVAKVISGLEDPGAV